MCRLLLSYNSTSFHINQLLYEFAHMCKASPSPDGDWQGDGWGISWRNRRGQWCVYKNAKPIWRSIDSFDMSTESTVFMMHARSKSFQSDLVNTRYNQPYVKNGFSFIFNGQLHGVRMNVPGTIGAEKVFNLILSFVRQSDRFLEKTREQLNLATKHLIASNIIIADSKRVYALCNHNNKTPDYHALRYALEDDKVMICSQELPSMNGWRRFRNKEVKRFDIG